MAKGSPANSLRVMLGDKFGYGLVQESKVSMAGEHTFNRTQPEAN
jgi:hypothetical protein